MDFLHGSYCGITDKKPLFNKTCPEIKFSEKFEEKLKEANIEYEKVRRSKSLTYIYFVVFLVISIGVFSIGYYLWAYISEITSFSVSSIAPFIIMALSIAPLGMAFGALNSLNSDLKQTKINKEKVDNILKLYGIEYNIKIRFGKKYHGVQEVDVDLDLLNL